jgi:dolichol-phosphate mannosyltransferase
MNVEAQAKSADEFVCQSCFLVKRRPSSPIDGRCSASIVRSDLVTVVVPTYNERHNLPHLAAAIRLHGYRLTRRRRRLAGRDGPLADAIAAPDPGWTVLHRKQGGSRAGVRRRLRPGSGRALRSGDRDGCRLLAQSPGSAASGRRGGGRGRSRHRIPLRARRGDTGLARPPAVPVPGGKPLRARLMLGSPSATPPPGSGRSAPTPSARSRTGQAQASGYGFQVEMAMRAHDAGMRIVEIPVVFRDRTVGTSKMNGAIVREAMWLVTRGASSASDRRRTADGRFVDVPGERPPRHAGGRRRRSRASTDSLEDEMTPLSHLWPLADGLPSRSTTPP